MAYKYLLTEEGATFRLYALIPLTVQPTYQQEDESDASLEAAGYVPFADDAVCYQGDLAEDAERFWIHESAVWPPQESGQLVLFGEASHES